MALPATAPDPVTPLWRAAQVFRLLSCLYALGFQIAVNDDLDRCFGDVKTILNYSRADRAGKTDPNFLNARRLRRQENELWLTSFVQKLQREA